jgi:membrane fusion protein, multidrug efflux system
MSARRRRRTGRWLLGAVGVLAVAGAAVSAGGYGLTSEHSSSGGGGKTPPATATVTKQTLVDRQSETGQLGYGDSATMTARLPGTVTALPAAGTTVQRGQPLYRVDNEPVVLLLGTLPAYRTLAPGVTGSDVKEFEQNLWQLGYRGFTVDDTYSAATANAVRDWQDDLGLDQTGVVELGRVVVEPAAVRVDALKAAVGDQAQPGAALYTYTGTTRLVTVQLNPSDQRLAQRGAAVRLTLPDGTGTTGTITEVTSVVDEGDGSPNSTPTTKLQVTITADDATKLAGLDAATVTVELTAAKKENVLTVPVAALLALAEGGYGVQIVSGGATHLVAVTTGLFADGRVEVTGDGIAEGVTVGMPS